MLREREQHIQLLEGQLTESRSEFSSLLELHRALTEELEASNRWASSLREDLDAAGERIVKLQNELEAQTTGYEAKVLELEEENRAKTAWALDTEARFAKELAAKCEELAECVRLLESAEQTIVERTLWAQQTEAQREELAAQLSMVRASRWIRLGRKMGLGPNLDAKPGQS